MSAGSYIFEGTAENFDRLVLENSHKGLVLVDFWAPWVGPSMKQREILCVLARSYAGRFLLVAVNTDQQKPLAERFGVRSLPSFKLFRNGKMIGQYHGVQPEADYPRIIDAHVARQLDKASAEAVAAWQSGDPARALQLLANAAVETPENLAYPALMSKILMREGREADAHALLSSLPERAQVEPEVRGLLANLDFILTAREAEPREVLELQIQKNPDAAEARYHLAASLLVADELEAALEQLHYLSRHHGHYRSGIARKEAVQQMVLAQIGADLPPDAADAVAIAVKTGRPSHHKGT